MADVGTTNVVAVDLFVKDLLAYEAIVKPTSGHYVDYHEPLTKMKSALERLVTATEADTYTMMRHLVDHINTGMDTAYSEYTISFLAASTRDERAKQLIMAVLYITRSMLDGEWDELGDDWLGLVDDNTAIRHFLRNYTRSDQMILGETYSGNVIRSGRSTETITVQDACYTLEIGSNNYKLELDHGHPVKISFRVSDEIQPGADAHDDQPLVITSQILIVPSCAKFILDDSIHFFDDALAQMKALNCLPHGHAMGEPTLIELPGIFYGASISLISSNSGGQWRISEINIVPPALS